MTEAVKQLKKFSLDDHQREEYEQRLKAMRDHRSSMAAEFKKGEESGVKKGEEIGIRKGEEIGVKKGKLEAIEMALEIKFGADGLQCMESVRAITDVGKLTQVQQLVKQVATLKELRQKMAKL